MGPPRVVRIPRSSARPVRRARASPPGPTAPASAVDRRANVAGSQRAFRVTLLYLGALALLYAAFLAYDRSTAGGSSPGATSGLEVFTGIAVLLGAGGAFFALGSAPRAVEVRTESIVVVGRWGRRLEWTPRSEFRVRLVRRYPPGLLAVDTVDSVEVGVPGRAPKSYLVQSGLFPETVAPA